MPRKTPRRHQQGDESRKRILVTTLEIAAERGYDGTTVALVTERTGLPASSVYWHFKNKDELLAETLEFSYRQWRDSTPTWSAGDAPDDLAEEIRERLHTAARAISVSPEFWRLGLMLALERRAKEPAARRRYVEVRDDTARTIEQWWRSVLPPAVIERHDDLPHRLARTHLAMMDGFFIGVRSGADWDLEVLVDLLATGLHAHIASLEKAA